MALLNPDLALWLYPAPIGSNIPTKAISYTDIAEGLSFTTVAPGGFGELSFQAKLKNARLWRQELQLFSRVALVSRHGSWFLGEITDPELSMTNSEEYINISALGVGNCLRDDPANFSYLNATARGIMSDQFFGAGTIRQTYNMPISLDLGQVFPDNPAATYTLSYAWRTVEDIFNDLCGLLGNYTWGVWDHPSVYDALNFHTGQMYAHAIDFSTVTYQATIAEKDIIGYSITPSAERAYNRVEVGYNEPSSGPPAFVSATDSRLNPSTGDINLAPFRRRKYARDLAGNSAASSANAQILANSLLSQYRDGGAKISLTLQAVRDYASGQYIPLHQVRADSNIYVPEFSLRSPNMTIGGSAFGQKYGVNVFYIVRTSYRESSDGPQLELTCDNYINSGDTILARLQYLAERQARTGSRTTEQVQALGALIKGWANISFQASAGAQIYSLQGTSFRPILAAAPTSITWADVFKTNCTGPSVNNITAYGFNAWVTSSAGGAGSYGGNFTTVGNCVYDVDEAKGTFTHHCEACGLTREKLKLKRDVEVAFDPAGQPSMTVVCVCGVRECFNLALGAEDEVMHAHNPDHRAEQARHIRAMMRHPHVGLHAHVRGPVREPVRE